jgi:hypothetical protein
MLGGSAMLAYASDFPHDHGDSIAPWLDELSAEDRAGTTYETAAAFYGLDVVRTYTSP